MAALSEQAVINKLAGHAESISGIRKSYAFGQNPDSLKPAELPAIMFYPSEFTSSPKGHYNFWNTSIEVVGVLFVAERQSRGGTLKFLENAAMPFGLLFRTKFQTASVISDILGVTSGVTVGWLESGRYGAGGPQLTMNNIPYIGWIFTWRFEENT